MKSNELPLWSTIYFAYFVQKDKKRNDHWRVLADDICSICRWIVGCAARELHCVQNQDGWPRAITRARMHEHIRSGDAARALNSGLKEWGEIGSAAGGAKVFPFVPLAFRRRRCGARCQLRRRVALSSFVGQQSAGGGHSCKPITIRPGEQGSGSAGNGRRRARIISSTPITQFIHSLYRCTRHNSYQHCSLQTSNLSMFTHHFTHKSNRTSI